MNIKVLGLISVLVLIVACAPSEPKLPDMVLQPIPEPTVNKTNTTFVPIDNESVYVNIDDINNMTSNDTVVNAIVGNKTMKINLSDIVNKKT